MTSLEENRTMKKETDGKELVMIDICELTVQEIQKAYASGELSFSLSMAAIRSK